jgi:hypothetical protein
MVSGLLRWRRYRRALAALMRQAADEGCRVRSRQRFEEMRTLARISSMSR